jgi:3-dehydroquinate dehydratase / shikimate dehydrogenase
MTLLCVPIFVNDVEQGLRDAARAGEAGADLVEYRIDRMEEPEEVCALVRTSPLPCIVTCRSQDDGGQSRLSWVERIALLSEAAAEGAKYVDVELATYRKIPRPLRSGSGRPVILSMHDHSGRPPRLHNLEIEMAEAFASAHKIVWTARTVRDNIEAFEVLQRQKRPTIALCMGEAGLISRVLAKKFGAFLTFAPLSAESATADGQVPIDLLKRIYRWDAVGPKTRVFGVVGHPVAHSLSPHVHHAAFEAIGFDGVYVPLLVEPSYESFKAFMETFVPFPGLDLSGLSITIPHKENALRYLIERGSAVDELARRTGAVNTITIDRAGDVGGAATLRGTNTDFEAILESITAALAIDRSGLAGRRVAVIGAGGTGRTAVAALASCGCDVTIYSRNADRAAELARQFEGQSCRVATAELARLGGATADIFFHATPLGMHPNVDASPFDAGMPVLGSGTVVFDTVYTPRHTRLLHVARHHGARAISGVEMFVRQAEAQFRIWTGCDCPSGVMRSVVENPQSSSK